METTEIEVLDIEVELQVFDPVANAIAEAKKKNANLIFDYEDKQGNKDARSHIAQLRRLKAPISEVHKLAKAQAKKLCDALDGKKRELIGAVDDMIEVHHKPIWEIEQREIAKKAEEELAIQQAKEAEEAARQAEIEAREKAIAEREAEVKRQQEAIERKQREVQIAKEAEDRAKKEAEQALIDAENRRIADIEKAKQQAREEAAAKDMAEKSARAAEEAAEQARIADENHRNQIHKEIYDALLNRTGVLPNDAKAVGVAIRDGKIPHVSIQY